MKIRIYLLAVALLAGAAHADTLFTVDNDVGGRMYLTDRSCEDGSGSRWVYTVRPRARNSVVNGCYIFDPASNMFIIQWEVGITAAVSASEARAVKRSEVKHGD